VRDDVTFVWMGMGRGLIRCIAFPQARGRASSVMERQSSNQRKRHGARRDPMKIIGAEALALLTWAGCVRSWGIHMPKAAVHGGSATTAASVPRIQASLAARAKLLDLAKNDSRSPLRGADRRTGFVAEGRISL